MIIESLLDTDLYKFTMMQVVLHHFPSAQVEYRFKCRTPDVDLTPYHRLRSSAKFRACAACASRAASSSTCAGWRFLKSDFVDLLGLFHLHERFISISHPRRRPSEIDITINGPWLHTILFEVPVLAIVSEVYFRNTQPRPDFAEGRRRLARQDRADQRGPRSGISHRRLRHAASVFAPVAGRSRARAEAGHRPKFVGTSNVYFALEHGLTPLGTMAHEYLQACQAVGPRLRDSQVFAFNTWAREYRGDLGIALSDVCGMEAFLRDFDLFFCKLFDGVRHDSGDPFEWGEKLITHYAGCESTRERRRWCSRTRSTCHSRSGCSSTSRAAARPRSASAPI